MEEKNLDLIKTIQQRFPKLSKSQKLIAQYIMTHYDKAAFMTAANLGDIVGVSESTVVRLANTLGFDGYRDLQKILQDLVKNKLTTVQRISMSEEFSHEDIFLKKVLKRDIENIRQTMEKIDIDVFEKVVDSIYEAKSVYILAFRSSTFLAGFLGFYLGLILDNVKVVSFGVSDVFEQLIKVSKDDLVIGISYPRYSKKTLEALKFVKGRKCKIVGITDSLISPAASLADYTLIANSNMVSFVDSLVAPMSLLNSLIIAVGMKNKKRITEYFEKLEDIWKEYSIYENSKDDD